MELKENENMNVEMVNLGKESKKCKERKMAKCGIWTMESRVKEGKNG
jgi:hypothetical protein